MSSIQSILDEFSARPSGAVLKWRILQCYRRDGSIPPSELDNIEAPVIADIFRLLTPEQWQEGLTCKKQLESLTFRCCLKKMGFPVEAIEQALRKHLEEANSPAKIA